MIPRVLEPEVMDSAAEAAAYDRLDHAEVNRRFVDDLLARVPARGNWLDLGTGTALIPLEICRRQPVRIVAVDAAREMLALATAHVAQAGMADWIALELADAKCLPHADARFDAVISNSIVHHMPRPEVALAEAWRVLRPGGNLFFRDLLRPESDAEVTRLVELHASTADALGRQLFADSLRAALSLDELRAMVVALGAAAESVEQTSDRHWTWFATKPPR